VRALDHEPPCPAPHHTQASRAGAQVRLRILFTAPPELEHTTRQRISLAWPPGSWPVRTR